MPLLTHMLTFPCHPCHAQGKGSRMVVAVGLLGSEVVTLPVIAKQYHMRYQGWVWPHPAPQCASLAPT